MFQILIHNFSFFSLIVQPNFQILQGSTLIDTFYTEFKKYMQVIEMLH